eukprot:GHVL01036642.1.p1 GENE.GHVL01036642.1~~GHVL01036642.1.p1  ORF type:complete len:375 (+),score=41.50 GHVL01036642.1:39-1163(+)
MKESEPLVEICEKKRKKGIFNIFRSNYILSFLTIFVPLGFLSYYLKWGHLWVFTMNFMSIVPLAWLLGKATEDLSISNHSIGGLLNATFGNIVEMLICIAGLRQNQITVVQCTLMGSILSNLLLVMGTAFFLGGWFYKIQEYSAVAASTHCSLLTLSCLCLVLPTAYATIMDNPRESELAISRSISILLAFIYVQYLFFQLKTHTFLFENDEEDEDEPDLNNVTAIGILGICTVLVASNSEMLISSIAGVVDSWAVSKEFIGIILLPIIGNAAEHYTAITVAVKNKMDLSLGVAVGSSCQMALFVTPFSVLVGWIFDKEMTLNFHPLMATVLVLSVLIVTKILSDGHSNWLEGSMLITAYVAISFVYFFETTTL